ncbi:DUF5615 family PIN-like protein [Roseomonas sp. CCTCC AB2023176]|uniref:DUF5615 family PIN-like protein n=1 Tax=Roseomonas sp. CCTCC AB2023176 TaxID=3342640 RepID=UPI0035E2A3BD
MRDPFLFDECLSPDLAAFAHARGKAATHVNFPGLSGTPDHRLMRVIRDGGYVFVTSTARDFLRLYAQENIHDGLVIVVPGDLRVDEQARYFGGVLAALEPLDDLTTKLVEVFSHGAIVIRGWPAS